jgi:hypothetical protein
MSLESVQVALLLRSADNGTLVYTSLTRRLTECCFQYHVRFSEKGSRCVLSQHGVITAIKRRFWTTAVSFQSSSAGSTFLQEHVDHGEMEVYPLAMVLLVPAILLVHVLYCHQINRTEHSS